MNQNEKLKLDVRVRARLLSRGALTPGELEKHLAALPDGETQSEVMDLKQPALGDAGDGAMVPTTGKVGAEAGSDEDLVAP